MCLLSDTIYYFCFFILVHGYFDDNRIVPTCEFNCDINLKGDSDHFDYCDHRCQIKQNQDQDVNSLDPDETPSYSTSHLDPNCFTKAVTFHRQHTKVCTDTPETTAFHGCCKDGCSLYQYAIAHYPCSTTCTHWIYQNISEAEQGSSITQTKKQSCIQGCSFGLEKYYREIVPYGVINLPAPSVVKESITHNSVELEWSGDEIPENISFILKKQVTDINREWQVHNETEVLTTGSLNVTNLFPYVTYKFRLTCMITTEHFIETAESAPVTTLPFGAPSSPPTITSLGAPSSSVISVSWLPPLFTNRPLVNYHLSLHPLDGEDHVIDTDVSPNVTSWIFGHLLAGKTYGVHVSAVNKDGEGPEHKKNITMPIPGNLSENEMPWLVLGAENMVVKQSLLELTRQSEKIISRPQSILVTGVGVHVRAEQVLVADSSGMVTLINVSGDNEVADIYPMLGQPTAIDVDWLNNFSYVIDGHRIYQCTMKPQWNQCKTVIDIAPRWPNEVKVDPINGYLYYTLMESKKGLYRLDLEVANIPMEPVPKLLINADLSTFIIDHENLQLYFPNNTLNTIMSAYLDGTGVTNMRQGTVARPHFTNIESIVIYDERFFWTNGTRVFSEDYDVGNRTYYHNSLLLFERHFRDINMYYPRAQPIPAPVNPPSNVQVLFTVFKAVIEWRTPQRLTFQGEGAYNRWNYEVMILEDDGSDNALKQITSGMQLVISNLVPNTHYQVKVRAFSTSGTGPWSDVFYGKTLSEEMESARLIVAMQRQHQYKTWDILEVGIDGETSTKIIQTSPLNPGVTDIAWSEDRLFWTTDDEDVYMYQSGSHEAKALDFVKKAACVAFDWLGERIYWSGIKNNMIRRSDLFGIDIEFVFQSFLVRDMVLDSVQGRLYWVTMTTVETTTLNGKDHMQYFAFPEICCQHVVSVAIDFESRKLLWYVQRYEDQSLYMADLYSNQDNMDTVINSVELVGTFTDIEKYSKIQFISHHLYWMNGAGDISVGNTQCNYTASISALGAPVTMFSIKHPSLHTYPDGLNSSTLNVIPTAIAPQSIVCQGEWSNFNVTWQPSSEVNHGTVSYELVIEAEGMDHTIMVTDNSWYNIQGLDPYTPITLQVRGFTFWGSGPVTMTTLKSPMAAPTIPQDPKVYVNQRKNAASSKLTLAADFRWNEPETINGILNHQNVFYWTSTKPNQKSSTRLTASSRHFILDGLEGNTTYFFEVECCTQVACGPRSLTANATADSVNPVPKLLLAMTDSIQMAEAENVENTSVTITTKSVVAMSYLAQESTHYWITRDNRLEQYMMGTSKELLKLEDKSHSMTLDWISRTLYILEGDAQSGQIIRYCIDQSTSDILDTREAQVGHIVMDPYTSTLIWSEKVKGDKEWTMVSRNINGQGVHQHFGDEHRRRRATGNTCNCPPSQQVSTAMTMDLSPDGNTEVIFIDTDTYALLAADMQGCMCRTLMRTTANDRKGLPADYMTVDHVYVYWYNEAMKTLYTMDKQSKRVMRTQVNDIRDILAFGPHLHPLPGSECLDTTPYKDQVEIVTFTNTSVKVSLHAVTWPESCANISHPVVKYTVYYRPLDPTNPKDDCQPSGQLCMSKEAYSQEINLDGLEPYTYYVIHGSVSNYYSVYSATSLGEATVIRTRPGVPSPITNITARPHNPNNITVSWPQPAEPNGPLDKIVYYVEWSTQSGDGISHALKTDAITYDAMDLYDALFTVEIGNLISDQTYSVQVISHQTIGNYKTESAPVKVHTFQEPSSLDLIDITNTSIELSWRSPSDDSINLVYIYFAEVIFGEPSEFSSLQDDLPLMTMNYTMYNKTFPNLKPNTDYTFRLNIIYRYSSKIYYWPQDDSDVEYTFRTLTGIPGQPEPPKVEEFKSGEFEVSWTAPEDHGEKISHYMLQYRPIDKENWTFAFNTTNLRWVVDDDVLQRGFTYVFQVKAENKNGWGSYSVPSIMFSYPILEAEPEDSMVTAIAVGCAFVFVVVAMVVIALCFSVCRRRKEEKKKTTEFIAIARGPDLELANLRELPLTAIQQNNTLYAMNLVPTDDEIAALPHFRRDQLVLCKFLGSGAFGEVFEGVAKNILNESSGDTRCAVKTLRKSASDQEKEEFLKEALLMSNFRHEHILSLLGVCLDNDPQFIILELMEGGDLLSFMRACRLSSIQNKAELSLTDLVKVCVHVSRGCKYLEDMHFVHRDLAARNCLVSSLNPSTMVVKIGDFGLARDIYKNDYYRKEGEGLLPVRWMSPESLVDGVFTTQSDIWAFGVLMWEVFTFGQQPYPARTNIEVLHYVRSAGLLDRPDNCPDDFYQLMCKCWSFNPEDRPSFAFLLQQLEKFQETCASLAEYLVPIRSNNGPIATVDGYKYLTQRSRRLTSTSSDGPENEGIGHNGYGSHKSYGKIRRATSFDSPEPKDATQQILTDASNYLEPKSHRAPQYIEFLPDSRTENYVYNVDGERMRHLEKKFDNTHSSPRHPSYVQTTVKENLYPNSAEYIKYIQTKGRPVIEEESDTQLYKRFSHQESSADSVIMKTVENIPKACINGEDQTDDSKSACNEMSRTNDNNATYAQVMSLKRTNHFRKHRLDSSNSIMSFDSVQTEPAYSTAEFQNHRNKLYSSSSSKSNYSMSNISESIAEHIDNQPEIDLECQQFWANNAHDPNFTLKGQTEVKSHTDYLNISRRSQVYPENMGPLAGYDIVHASLV